MNDTELNIGPAGEAARKPKKSVGRKIASAAVYILIIAAIFYTFLVLIRFASVNGASMESTLENGDLVLVTNIMYTPKQGDVVVISHTDEYEKAIIKRVIATEGQTLQLDYDNNRIIVDGEVLDEDYINNGVTFGFLTPDYDIPTVIPEGKVFVMGDNRSVSMDSRDHKIGLVDTSNIIGKAQFVLFPFNDRFGSLYK